jgi:N-acetyl-gamma-glutamyl-phosphate reductase
MVYPLIKMGILPSSYPLTCISLTGYSGGGKTMINAYESKDGAVKTADMYSPRMYGLDLNHKHIPEIMAVTGLSVRPIFCPIVDDYYSGIAASITLFNESLNGNHSTSSIIDALSEHYKGEKFIKVNQKPGSGMLESNWGVGTNNLEITVSGSDTQLLLTARFDNLGKGASGAAVQNMNLMLGLNEEEGL